MQLNFHNYHMSTSDLNTSSEPLLLHRLAPPDALLRVVSRRAHTSSLQVMRALVGAPCSSSFLRTQMLVQRDLHDEFLDGGVLGVFKVNMFFEV